MIYLLKNKTRQTMTNSPSDRRQKHKDKLIASQSQSRSVYCPKSFIHKCSYMSISGQTRDLSRVCRHSYNNEKTTCFACRSKSILQLFACCQLIIIILRSNKMQAKTNYTNMKKKKKNRVPTTELWLWNQLSTLKLDAMWKQLEKCTHPIHQLKLIETN